MPIDAASRSRPPYGGQAIYVGAVLLVTLPYVVSFTSQLCSDDFILLYYYGRQPLWALGKFFDPHTVWTYHPLQNLYYAIGWHLSGIEPWSYRAMSLGLHVATALLLMKFGRDLTGSLHFGGCSAILFAGQWRHWEAVAWAGSIATLESTFFAILACTAFLRFLRQRRPTAYVLMILASVGWFFSKETIIQLPLLLAAIYLYWRWRETHAADGAPAACGGGTQAGREPWIAPRRSALGDLAVLLAVPVALVIAYLVFYVLFVHNIYEFARLGYQWAPFETWPAHVLAWLDRSFNPLLENEVSDALGAKRLLAWIARWHIVPGLTLLLIFLFAAVRRRMLALFALAVTFVGMVPYAVLLWSFYGPRYYYAVMLGVSLLAVALGRELWRLTRGKRKGWPSWLRIVVAATGGLWVVASFFQLTNSLLSDSAVNRGARELYDFFATQTDKADREALFVVDTRLLQHTTGAEVGWGLLECAKLALESDKVAAVELGFDLDWHFLAKFNACREKYLVMRKETGWWANRLPDHFRLTMAPDGRGGVALEEQF